MSTQAKWVMGAVVILLVAFMYRPARYEVVNGGTYGVYLYDKFF